MRQATFVSASETPYAMPAQHLRCAADAMWQIGPLSPPRRRPTGFPVGVFYEKAPNVKAALAAFLTRLSELRSVPESSIRTLKESVVGLGA